jgi:hypothetical protein
MANPSLQIGNSNWAIKEDNLLGYSTAGTRFVPQPITMTRASAGTRVNSSGLVETVELLGSEDVRDGNFPTPNTEWGTAAGWTIADNKATSAGANEDAYLTQSNMVLGKTYKVTFDVDDYTSGALSVRVFGQSQVLAVTSTGSYVVYLTPVSTTVLGFRSAGGAGGYVGSVSNVSVKESTKNNLARVDYDGTASSLLVEPERTNELLQSNQFDTTWNQSGTLTSGQDGVGGSTNAWKFQNPGATSSMFQYDTTSGVQTMSAYFKKNSNYGVRLYAFGSVNCWAYFDLNNGAVVSTGNSTAKIETAGADWFRCSMTFDQTNTRCDFYVTNNAEVQVLGDYTIQYAQVEAGSYATSYIPTDGGTVTRVQDQYSKTGISNLINSEEGVLFVEMAALTSLVTLNNWLTITDGTASNSIAIVFETTGTTTARIESGGVTQAYIAKSGDYSISRKLAFKWKVNDFAFWIDGVEIGTDVSGSTFSADTLNSLQLTYGSGGNYTNGKVKQLQVFKTALTDSELATLTT